MALVKCPDCEKMVSPRVEACPFCGCPAKFFISENEDFSIKGVQGTELTDQNQVSVVRKETITFEILNHKYNYFSDAKPFSTRFGEYLCYAEELRRILEQAYDEYGDISRIIEEFPKRTSQALEIIINESARNLYERGVVITPEQFWGKYNEIYCMEYSLYCTDILEIYAEILTVKEEMRNIRNRIKASRGRWQGGGFGVKGAIKGAVTASMLNAGSDIFHSFGDAVREHGDNREIQNRLKKLYGEESTKHILCEAAHKCVMSVFYAERDELSQSGYFKEIILLDKEKADALYDTTIKYAQNEEKRVENILQCIEYYPGEVRFYEEIIDYLTNYTNELYEFLEFWNIKTIMSGYICELEKIKRLHDFEKYVIGNGGLVDYTTKGVIRTIQVIENFSKGNKTNPFESNEFAETIDSFFLNAEFDVLIWKDVRLVEFAATECKDYTSFLKQIRRHHRILGTDVFQDIWIIGDEIKDIDVQEEEVPRGAFCGFTPDEKILEFTKTKIDGKSPRMLVYYYEDISGGNKGFCITEHYILDLETLQEIPLRKVESIVPCILENKRVALDISDGNMTIRIENERWKGYESGIEYFANVLRILFVKYFSNVRLWRVELGIPKPEKKDEELPDDVRKNLDKQRREVLYGKNDWRTADIVSETSNEFCERFIEACRGTELVDFVVNEQASQLSTKEDKWKYFSNIYPNEKILWVKDSIVVSLNFLNWPTVHEINNITDIWMEQSISGTHVIIVDKKDAYKIECKLEDRILVAILRYSLKISQTMEQAMLTSCYNRYTELEEYIGLNFPLSQLNVAAEHYRKKQNVDIETAKDRVNFIIQKATEMVEALRILNVDAFMAYDVLMEERVCCRERYGLLRLDYKGIAFIADKADDSFYVEIDNIKKVDKLQYGNTHCFRISVRGKFLLYSFVTADGTMWVNAINDLIGRNHKKKS